MNRLKNEYIIKLGEKEILLRPSFSNLASVESQVGSLSYIAWMLAAGRANPKKSIPLTDMAKVIFYCQVNKVGDKPEYSLDEIWEMIQEASALAVYADFVIFMSQVTAGNRHAVEVSDTQKKS